MAIICTTKHLGETPLEAIERLREQGTIAAESPAVYAGRLDPMASGLLLILTDEDRHTLPQHLAHSKTYVANIILGFSTDSHDALGIPTRAPDARQPTKETVEQFFLGTHALPFPVYSAYKVQGKPLHWWARNARVHEITIPKTDMQVDAIRDVAISTVMPSELLANIESRINLVAGDFRQAAILNAWRAELSQTQDNLLRIHATLEVTSGTYIRSLAHALGTHLKGGAFLYTLERTKIGPFTEPTV